MTTLRLGTRGSRLALIQANAVAEMLRASHPGLEVELVEITTAGDRDRTSSLAAGEGFGWFTSALQEALRAGEIDLAVHSHKDLPTARPDGLVIAAIPARADARDAFIGRAGASLADLPAGATVGTSSPRRAAQLAALRPDITLAPIRGNVDTRLGKLESGEYDGTVLAMAGLTRMGLDGHATQVFAPGEMLPAPAQGALAVECCAGDGATVALLSAIDDAAVRAAVTAERAFLATLQGGCAVAAGAHATMQDGTLQLDGMLAQDGAIYRAQRSGPAEQAAPMGDDLARELLHQSESGG